MTYNDYARWAEDYRDQAEILWGKIEKCKAKRRFATAKERELNENKILVLYEEHRECLATYKLLTDRAEAIKEAECFE